MAGVGDRVGGFQRDLSPYFQASEDLPVLPSGLKDVDDKGYKKYDAEIREWWTNMQENLDRLQEQLINFRLLDLDEKHTTLNTEGVAALNSATIGLGATIANEAATAASNLNAHTILTNNPHSVTATQAGAYTIAESDSAISTAIANLVDSAPTTLDTLNELAAALGDDANFSTTVTSALGTHTTDIATNATDIATNATNIAANTSAIASTQADVDANETAANNAIAAVQADVDANETAANNAIAAVQADVDANETTTNNHAADTSNPHSVTATQVGLGSASNHASIAASDLIDEDDMASDSDTKVPSQQSVKKYVDDQVVSASTREFHYARCWASGTIRGFNTSCWGTGVNLTNYNSGANGSGCYGGPGASAGAASPYHKGADYYVATNDSDSNSPFILKTYWRYGWGHSIAEIIVPAGGGTWFMHDPGAFLTKANCTTPHDFTTFSTSVNGIAGRDRFTDFIVGKSTTYPNGSTSNGVNGDRYVVLMSFGGGINTSYDFGGVWERIG